MQQTISVLEMTLPVIVMILVGYMCRVKGLVSKEGLAGIKSVISNITLPIVLLLRCTGSGPSPESSHKGFKIDAIPVVRL